MSRISGNSIFSKLGGSSFLGGSRFGSGIQGSPIPLGGASATFAQMGSNILGGPLGSINYQGLLDQMLGETAALGARRRTQIQEGSEQLLGDTLGDLQGRGLLSSALNANVRESVEDRRQNQLAGLEEDLAGNRIDILGNIGSRALGSQEDLLRSLIGYSRALRTSGGGRSGSYNTKRLIHQTDAGETGFPKFYFADRYGNVSSDF